MKERIAILCIVGPGAPRDSLRQFIEAAPGQGVRVLETLEFPPHSGSQPSGEAEASVLWADPLRPEPEKVYRFISECAPVPVIIVSAAGDSEWMLELMRHGASDCLTEEEVTPGLLVRAIHYAVQRRRFRGELSEKALEKVRQEAARSHRQLRDSEALTHSLVENLVQNIFRKDLQGRFTFANTNFCLAIGRALNEVLGKTDFDFFPEDLAAKYQADDLKVITTRKVLETEEEHETASGERLVVKVVKTPVYNAAGEIIGMQGIFWDITEQKRAQEELAASRERFALAVRGSTDGIWDWDIGTDEIYFSSRFKRLLGYSYDELEDRFEEWEKRMHPDDRDMALAAFENHLKYESPFDVEYRLRCKEEHYRWFRVRGLAVRNAEGKATRMAGSISDITKRKEAEAQLRARTEDLERSNRDLEQFAYIASHDLKEPLRMISSYVQLLEHRYADQLDVDARDFISFAADGAKRMKRLIDGLLEFSRIGTHGRELAPTDSDAVLEETLANLEVLIQEKDAQITHDSLPMVLADPVQLGQLFQNLVGNGLKFSKGNPQIHISAERRRSDGRWTFFVTDNGIGLDPEHAEKIFQIYQRLHSRGDYEGTGIGLAVCRKIVERHGGEIGVKSELNKGSTFHFTMKSASGS